VSTIHFEAISKQFVDATAAAVVEVTLDIPSGAFVVLLGPSGCGKTTLLRMVNRLIEPTSGAITLEGEDIRQLEPVQLRRRIGYVIQQVGLFPHMTVAQNIAVVPELLGWSRERIQARVRELLDLVALPAAEYCSRYPAQLSGGQQQRVGVARALAGDPGVVLMDEPFGAIDAITRATLQDELLHLQRQLRKTVLFVTHDVEEALRLADKIVVMREGRIVQYDTPLAILTQPADAFVSHLVGAEDMVRQLGLIRVEAAMTPLDSAPGVGVPTLPAGADLRQALSLLLRSGASRLLVLSGGVPVGQLTLDRIRAATRVVESA
jgi:osmoprotectant transport system ATP-binding protein